MAPLPDAKLLTVGDAAKIFAFSVDVREIPGEGLLRFFRRSNVERLARERAKR